MIAALHFTPYSTLHNSDLLLQLLVEEHYYSIIPDPWFSRTTSRLIFLHVRRSLVHSIRFSTGYREYLLHFQMYRHPWVAFNLVFENCLFRFNFLNLLPFMWNFLKTLLHQFAETLWWNTEINTNDNIQNVLYLPTAVALDSRILRFAIRWAWKEGLAHII